MPRAGSPYAGSYPHRRAALLAGRPRCALRLVCDGAPATSADHRPPIAAHVHRDGSGCCTLIPACLPCQHRQGLLVGRGRWRSTPAPSGAWS
jgi:hypothetical protein